MIVNTKNVPVSTDTDGTQKCSSIDQYWYTFVVLVSTDTGTYEYRPILVHFHVPVSNNTCILVSGTYSTLVPGFAIICCLVIVRRVHIWSSGCRLNKYGLPDNYQTTYMTYDSKPTFLMNSGGEREDIDPNQYWSPPL